MTITTQSWSVIALCYNEEGSIYQVLCDIEKTLTTMGVPDYEIIIVDDGSTDNSADEVSKFNKICNKSRIIQHETNMGIGAAIKTGYFHAKKENVIAMASDGQFQLEHLIPHSTIKPSTFLSFYRKDKGNYTLFRKFISSSNRLINKYLLGLDLKDVNWVKAYKRESLDSINTEINSSLVETEISTKLIKNNHTAIEIETCYLPRIAGEAKGASPKILFQALIELFKLIYVLRFKRVKIKNGLNQEKG